MKVKYLRDSKKRRIDIRDLAGGKLKHFTVTQGACSDGAYIYMAFKQKAIADRPHRIKIVKFSPATRKIIKVSSAMNLGHANDMAYHDGKLYITHSRGDKVIHTVFAKSLKKGRDINVKLKKKYDKNCPGFNGISKTEDGFIIRLMGGHYLAKTDDSLVVKDYIHCTNPFPKTKEDTQGTTYDNGTIIRAFSRLQSKNKNYICKFSRYGKLKSKALVKLTGELESVFMIDGKMYGTSYRKKSKDKKKKYMAYVFRIVK